MKTTKNILTLSLAEIAEQIREKRISPVEVVRQLLNRINEVDGSLNSYITVIDSENALKQAEKAEKEIEAGLYKGPLHGVPIGIKDVIYTKDMKTTMGSEIFQDYVPTVDAVVVKRLKEAGAIIIGKQNTHQFAYGPTGDRSHYGPVHNPYDLEKMTGGSSSGSAAAVSACLSYGALGTDTGGSVRVPASFCGIVGMKPTYERVSKQDVFPLSWNLDHVGPMTRTVMDNALLLNTVADDLNAKGHQIEDFTKGIKNEVKGLKIGLPSRFYFEDLNNEVRDSIKNSIEILRKLGVEFTTVELPDMDEITEAHRVLLRSDAYELHEKRLEDSPDLWDEEVKERLFTALDVKGHSYSRALKARKSAREAFDEVFGKVDAILTPTVPIFPPIINARHVEIDKYNDQHIRWSIIKLTAPTNFTGFPSLSVPCGFSSEGMPIGLQLIGKDFDEALLYRIAYNLEQKLSINTAKFDVL